MPQTTQTTEQTLFSGDWLVDDGCLYDVGFPGRELSRWGGGVEWECSLDVARKIVETQERLRAESTLCEYDRLTLDDDGTFVLFSSEDQTTYTYPPTVAPDGTVWCRVGFGWTWTTVSAEDCSRVVDA